MISSTTQQNLRSTRRGRAWALTIFIAGASLALAGMLAVMAFAASPLTIGSSSNSKLNERIAVNSRGLTLYALSPETTSHLLCKSTECFKVWPPVTVPSRTTELKAGAGVQGHLAILRRSNGMLQVTLRGLPLYRFAGDHAKGQANGQGIVGFGGTWHAVTASSSAPATSTPTSPPASPSPAPMPSTPGYGY